MSERTISYLLETEVPSSFIGKLLDFIYQKYLLPQAGRFVSVSRGMTDGEPSLAFVVLDSLRNRTLKVEINGSKPIKVKITPLDDSVTEQQINEAREDVTIATDFFEEEIRQNTLFFAWREGEEIVPERISGKEKQSINRMFLETQILLIVLFMGIGLFLFYFIGPLVPIVLLALQFVFVFYSNKLIARSADWRITESNPTIHLLEYPFPLEDDAIKKKIPRDELVKLKKEVYEQTISNKGELDCQAAHQIFSKYGIDCKPENLVSRKVNVYELVKKTADKFGFPMPEIVVSNTLLPNAAASGPSPSRGVVLITTGLFVQLEDDEIESVLGHEFGHLKGRDPLWLYSLSAVQYLLWFYVIFGLFPFGSFILFFIYFWAIMTVIYFIAKFFEARADLTSAMVIGQPQVLAKALERIGFKRLLYERVPVYRVQEWISLEPHPPIYFRVNRLRKLGSTDKIKHPLIQSAKEVTRGFLDSL
jgi:heat shock protein HtpX